VPGPSTPVDKSVSTVRRGLKLRKSRDTRFERGVAGVAGYYANLHRTTQNGVERCKRRSSQPPGKARPRSAASRQDPGGGRGATAGSVLEGGSEGEGRPPADGRNSSAVAVRFAVDAHCCGALGCRETDGLLLVEKGHVQRVLCQYHARRWLER
jgi:hypothetical protein